MNKFTYSWYMVKVQFRSTEAAAYRIESKLDDERICHYMKFGGRILWNYLYCICENMSDVDILLDKVRWEGHIGEYSILPIKVDKTYE